MSMATPTLGGLAPGLMVSIWLDSVTRSPVGSFWVASVESRPLLSILAFTTAPVSSLGGRGVGVQVCG